MYYSIVDAHLRYCCSVWGCAGDSIIKKLQKLQNRAARVVTNSHNDQTSLPLISQLGWLTVREMIDFEVACTVYPLFSNLRISSHPLYALTLFISTRVVAAMPLIMEKYPEILRFVVMST